MKFTDKAASASLRPPTGLNPSLIGKIVSVQVFKKEDDRVFPETIVKYVGVLKAYTLTSTAVYFNLDGLATKASSLKNDHVEFILYKDGF